MKKALTLWALVAAAALCVSAADAAATFGVRAASYNIRCELTESDSNNNWSARKGELVTLVKSIAPDVIGFQEVRSGQYTYLRNQLSDYTFVGEYRDTVSNAEATPVAFRKDRFTLLDSDTFWLSATPEVVGSKVWGGGIEDSGLPRICTWALLKDEASGGVFCFASTHLDLKEGPRLAGMQLVLSRLARFMDVGIPVVLVGDMNANETEDSMLAATERMQDSLLFSKTTPTGPWRTLNAWAYKNEEVSCAETLAGYSAAERTANTATLGKRIDYIFTSFGTEVESFAIRNDARPGMQYYPSDHYPVVADLVMSCLSDAWLRESAATSGWTGEWSDEVKYDADGRAYLGGEVAFTPCIASTGNVVTVETKAQFDEYSKDYTPEADVQAAVRLSTNGCFQVWRGSGNRWMDVVAEGVTPTSGEEYTLRVTFDYTANTYSVEVKTGLTEFTRLREKENPVNPVNSVKTNFPLAFSTNCVNSFAFVGDTYFTSLVGDCRYEIIGFVADEALVLSNNVEVVLSAVKAAWLNKCGGDKAAVQLAAAGLSQKEFDDAYLLNLDIADGSRSYAFAITDIAVGDTSVTVAVTLTRSGKIEQAINGTLKFYGAATLAGFKTAPSPLGSAVLSDDDFSDGDSAIATIPLDGEAPPAFFNAKIEE